ncbi:MAG: cytochrome c oxidase subunit 3 [Pararhizobium sp.]
MSTPSKTAETHAIREPWEDLERQRQAAITGFWVFSASELLFFGGIFVAYAVNFYLWPHGFKEAGAETEIKFGLANTIVLLTSSAVVALASTSSKWPSLGRFSRGCIWVTVLLGLLFLAIKGTEYADDVKHHLVPGPGFGIEAEGAQIFFAIYWTATALHAIHLVIGLGLLIRLALAGRADPEWYSATPAVHVTALYWGFVDVIWTIVFVLIYLPGRAS